MTTAPPPGLRRPAAAFVAIGAGAGLLSGLFGVGGGLLMVPALVLLVGVAQHRAHATSLAAIVPIALVGALVFGRADSVNVIAAAALAAGSLLGVQAGARAMGRLSSEGLALVFAGFVIVVALAMLPVTPLDLLALGAIGLTAGFAAGLLGVGGGIVMVPAMVLVLGFDEHVAQGTSLVVIIPAALAGSVTHYRNGRVSLRDAALLAAGGIGGAVVGSISALSVDDTVLRRLFGVFLLVVAAQMVIQRGRRRSESRTAPVADA